MKFAYVFNGTLMTQKHTEKHRSLIYPAASE